ncbi:MAG: sulfatase-like hydrolase/transferase, partial [Verrucomicrobiota bacterium]
MKYSLLTSIINMTLWLVLTASASIAQTERPNIIIMMADDLGYGDLSCFGHPNIQTPNLDKLATDGARFTSFYSAHPTCSPSRSGMMTGRTPYRSGIYAFISTDSVVHLLDEEVTLAEIAKEAGYSTAFYGKWGLIGDMEDWDQTFPHEQGFDHWIATHNNASPSHAKTDNFYEMRTDHKTRKSNPLPAIKGYSCGFVVDSAIDWLENGRDPNKPFFLVLWFHEPHGPIASPPEFEAKYPKSKFSDGQQEYYANVDHMDHQIGRLLTHLEDTNLKDSSWITFTSDNGPAQGFRGITGGLRSKKGSFYEGGYREPTIMYWKGLLDDGRVIDTPLTFFDLAPTFYDLLEVDKMNDLSLDGISMMPALRGETFEREVPPIWMGYRHTSMRQGDWKIWGSFDNITKGQSLTDYFRTRGVKKFELYNVVDDIAEKTDLSKQNPDVMDEMLSLYNHRYGAVAAEMEPWNGRYPVPRLVAERMGYNEAKDWDNYNAEEQEYLGWTPKVSDTTPNIRTSKLFSDAALNTPYSHYIYATSGNGKLTWSIQSGSLPSGLSLSASTGEIGGTPKEKGNFNFTVLVEDKDGDSDKQSYKLSVLNGPDPNPDPLGLVMHLDATVDVAVDGQLVTLWKDQSGNNNDATADMGSITYPSSETFLSGLSGLDFGSAASALELFSAQDSNTWLDQTGQNPAGFAVLMTYKRVGKIGNTREDLLGNQSNAQSGFLIRMSNGSIQSSLNGKTLSQSGSVKVGDTIVVGVNYHAGTGLFELWDSQSGTTSSTTVPPADFSRNVPVLLGMTTKTGRYLNGLVGEVKVFHGSLTAQNFASEQEALVQKWATEPGPGTAELVLHLNATDASSVEGNPVSQWSDLSGLGNHATPSKGAVTYPSLAFFPSGLKGLDFGSGRNTLEL